MQRDQAHRTNELLERIAVALEAKNKLGKLVYKDNGTVDFKPKDIPGFEGTLDALDVLTDIKTITDEYDTKNDELHKLVQNLGNNDYLEFCSIHNLNSNDAVAVSNYIAELDYEECLGAINEVVNIVDTNDRNLSQYEYDLQGIRVDDDHDIRVAASNFEEDYATKKDAILDYVENEFSSRGARYTDIIKFAYYLGAPNAPKYSNYNRGYYSCAFSSRMNGHLIQGGEDFLVKGINKNDKERYITNSSVNKFTDYYKRIS